MNFYDLKYLLSDNLDSVVVYPKIANGYGLGLKLCCWNKSRLLKFSQIQVYESDYLSFPPRCIFSTSGEFSNEDIRSYLRSQFESLSFSSEFILSLKVQRFLHHTGEDYFETVIYDKPTVDFDLEYSFTRISEYMGKLEVRVLIEEDEYTFELTCVQRDYLEPFIDQVTGTMDPALGSIHAFPRMIACTTLNEKTPIMQQMIDFYLPRLRGSKIELLHKIAILLDPKDPSLFSRLDEIDENQYQLRGIEQIHDYLYLFRKGNRNWH